MYFQKLDITKHKLIHEGPLTWRINKQKQIDLHVVLLEDLVLLPQKHDDKLVLRFQNPMMMTALDDTKFTHSPIINVENLMVKQVAGGKYNI
jgi:Rho guanine nucleotide exchange factor 12